MLKLPLFCATLFASAALPAQVMIDQSFQSPVGGLPADWAVNQDADNGYSEIASWRSSDAWAPSNGLLIYRTGSSYRSNVYYNGAGATDFSNYSGTVTMLVDSRLTYAGALLRAERVVRNATEAYFAGVVTWGQDDPDKLVISLNPKSHQDAGTILASVELPQKVGGVTTRLAFEALGEQISASLYLWDDGLGDWSTTPLASLSVTDDTYTSGLVGLRGAFSSQNRSAQFADFSITAAIPEPRTYALGAGVVMLLLAVSRRR